VLDREGKGVDDDLIPWVNFVPKSGIIPIVVRNDCLVADFHLILSGFAIGLPFNQKLFQYFQDLISHRLYNGLIHPDLSFKNRLCFRYTFDDLL
jgi:hypothetical protein